jgi:uncharacterized membrane protein YjjP (DUF1212 family)
VFIPERNIEKLRQYFQKQLPKLQNISSMESNLEYKIPTIEQISDLLTDIASSLMTSGAHTMRIIQNVSRMAKTFGYDIDLSVFQLSIMMSITNKENPSNRMTIIKKTKPLLLNFTCVSDISALSWDTYDKNLPYDEVRRKFEEIISQKRMSRWLVLILVGFANAAFCGLFKGDLYAISLVFIGTLAGFYVRQEMIIKKINHLVVFTTSAFVASLISGIGYVLPLGNTPEIALAASVLYLIPGVPLINSVLDIIEGHILTGIARLVNASSLIVCIAIGLFASMLILGLTKL